ncbi:hypothetical protein LCM19_06220 [Qipengyuania flava]|nr:hypothetical protein [Qipengyuania flava]
MRFIIRVSAELVNYFGISLLAMRKLEKNALTALFAFTALALAALTMPILVVFGSFLILPGLILVCAPTIALYGWLFALPYTALRNLSAAWWKAALAALVLPLAFGWALPMLINAETRESIAAAVANDFRPAQPLTIGGTVALLRDERTGGLQKADNSCDDLCLRFLYNGIAKTVYIDQPGQTGMAYTVEQRPVCPQFTYTAGAQTWGSWSRGESSADFTPKLGLKEVVEARVAGGDCLVRVSGRIRPDWTIERIALPPVDRPNGWSMAPGKTQGERITVYRHDARSKRPVGRFTNAYASILSVPLIPQLPFRGPWAWNRTTVGDSRWDWDSVTALRSLIAFDPDIPDATASARMRELLASALADPRRERDDAGIMLANSIAIDIVQNGAKPDDAALLAKAVADPRFTEIDFNWKFLDRLGDEFPEVGEAALNRLVEGKNLDNREAVYRLDGLVARLPDRFFNPPPPHVVEALSVPERADRLHSVIRRLALMGDAAVPILTQIIESGAQRASTIENQGYKRSDSLKAADIAARELCKIGPSGRAALPTIQASWALLDATSGNSYGRDTDGGKFMAIYKGRVIYEHRIVTLISLGKVSINEFTPPRQPSVTLNGSWQRYIESEVQNFQCSISGVGR